MTTDDTAHDPLHDFVNALFGDSPQDESNADIPPAETTDELRNLTRSLFDTDDTRSTE